VVVQPSGVAQRRNAQQQSDGTDNAGIHSIAEATITAN
jgi:hypothetical protein